MEYKRRVNMMNPSCKLGLFPCITRVNAYSQAENSFSPEFWR